MRTCTRIRRHPLIPVCLFVTAALAAGACGGGSGDDPSTEASAPRSTDTEPDTSTTGEPTTTTGRDETDD